MPVGVTSFMPLGTGRVRIAHGASWTGALLGAADFACDGVTMTSTTGADWVRVRSRIEGTATSTTMATAAPTSFRVQGAIMHFTPRRGGIGGACPTRLARVLAAWALVALLLSSLAGIGSADTGGMAGTSSRSFTVGQASWYGDEFRDRRT